MLCGSPFWSLCSVAGCAYLAWLALSKVRGGQLIWPADLWSILAYIIWIIFILSILADVRCVRERAFFFVVLANFALGIFMTAWTSASGEMVRATRYASLGLWLVGMAIGAWILLSPVQEAKPILEQKNERHA